MGHNLANRIALDSRNVALAYGYGRRTVGYVDLSKPRPSNF